MNAFARAFEAYLEHGITEKKWRSRRQWCRRVGTNSSNLTGIILHGHFPAIPTLEKWLDSASATEAEREELLSLCSKEKAENSREITPHLDGLHQRLDAARSVIAALVGLCAQKGIKVSEDIKKRIDAL